MRTPHPPLAAPLGEVETARLSLGRFRPTDLDELAGVFEHPEVWQYPYGRGMDRAQTMAFLDAQLAHWDDYGFGCWIARSRVQGRVLGYLGLSIPTFLPTILPAVEVGWRLAPHAWGHGYATEGATAALDQAFDTLGLAHVCSLPQTENLRSVRVAERLGMSLLGELVVPPDDKRGAVVVRHFAVTRDEWDLRPHRSH